MPMLLGTKEADILDWRESRELLGNLKEGLARKWGRSSAAEAEQFLVSLISSLQEELHYEAQLDEELSAVYLAVAAAGDPAELQPLLARHREVVSAHFSRRRSVLSLCGACSRMHDEVVSRAAQLSEERMLASGNESAPIYALLASGDRGREEETLYSRNRYILLHEFDPERFQSFGAILSDSLAAAGISSGEEPLWHGSLSQWRQLLKEGEERRPDSAQLKLSPLPPFASATRRGAPSMPEWQWRLEAMADLSFVTGYEPLAQQATSAAAGAFKQQRNRDPFFQLARQVIHLPLALGHFGRWRIDKSPEHKWEIDLERLALTPLVMAVRVLAVHAGVHEGGTLRRVSELLYRGALDVELAERLLKAFQCLMELRIESEIRTEESGAFANPEDFSMDKDARVRSSVEAVLSLQKIAYQKMVGEG